jgi:light-regulated signal transduction histidine kinase (bacteriophytochrome)
MVSNYLQLIERRYKEQLDATAHEFIGFAVEGAQRMQRLINDLLSYSRVGRRGAAFGHVSLADAFDVVTGDLRATIEQTGATITCDPLPRVWADGTQLTQLLQNLVANALKFHGEAPPRVHVGAERRGREWQISVRDNGIGIEPQYAERIFVIFQRLHTKSEYPGSGIGLSICKKIVNRHGGRIWVEPSPEGGSVFRFSLPVDRAEVNGTFSE